MIYCSVEAKKATKRFIVEEYKTRRDPSCLTNMASNLLIVSTVAILGIKTKWVTEITHVVDKHYFVDEQRFGPYKMWHHVHKFEKVDQGVLMTDIIHFKLPFPLFAGISYNLIVKKKLRQIFSHRELKLTELFSNESE